jgi:hypothetical protein
MRSPIALGERSGRSDSLVGRLNSGFGRLKSGMEASNPDLRAPSRVGGFHPGLFSVKPGMVRNLRTLDQIHLGMERYPLC